VHYTCTKVLDQEHVAADKDPTLQHLHAPDTSLWYRHVNVTD